MFLVYIFVALAVYGLFVGKAGLSIATLILAGFTWWALRYMDKREAEWLASTERAKQDADAAQELESKQCESGRSQF